MFEFDGIRNPKVEHQDYISGQVTTWYMTEEQMKEKWGERVELTEEKYNAERSTGKSNKQIAKEYGISEPKLYAKKKGWGNEEVKPLKENDILVDEKSKDTKMPEWKRKYEEMKEQAREWEERALRAEGYAEQLNEVHIPNLNYEIEELKKVSLQNKNGYQQERTARQALEEKVDYYENGNASRMQKENDNFRQIVRSMAEVI